MRQRIRRALVATFAAAVLLSGCAAESGGLPSSPSPTPPGMQALSEACADVRTAVAAATAELERLDPANPGAAVSAFTAIADELSTALGSIDNDQLAAILPPLQSGFADAADALQQITTGNLARLPDLQSAAARIQTQLTAFTSLCSTP